MSANQSETEKHSKRRKHTAAEDCAAKPEPLGTVDHARFASTPNPCLCPCDEEGAEETGGNVECPRESERADIREKEFSGRHAHGKGYGGRNDFQLATTHRSRVAMRINFLKHSGISPCRSGPRKARYGAAGQKGAYPTDAARRGA